MKIIKRGKCWWRKAEAKCGICETVVELGPKDAFNIPQKEKTPETGPAAICWMCPICGNGNQLEKIW